MSEQNKEIVCPKIGDQDIKVEFGYEASFRVRAITASFRTPPPLLSRRESDTPFGRHRDQGAMCWHNGGNFLV